jgi:hypothetical protein
VNSEAKNCEGGGAWRWKGEEINAGIVEAIARERDELGIFLLQNQDFKLHCNELGGLLIRIRGFVVHSILSGSNRFKHFLFWGFLKLHKRTFKA